MIDMKKIQWKPKRPTEYIRAEVGCVVMYISLYYTGKHGVAYPCFKRHKTATKTFRWQAEVIIGQRSETLRVGPTRKSMVKAKEDAVRLARELLLDYYVCLKAEMANFDLVE